jgi:hypothetical protein
LAVTGSNSLFILSLYSAANNYGFAVAVTPRTELRKLTYVGRDLRIPAFYFVYWVLKVRTKRIGD